MGKRWEVKKLAPNSVQPAAKKKGGASSAALLWGGGQLEIKPQPELHASRIVRGGQAPKVRSAQACADGIAAAAALRASAELCVVKQVEGFPFKVQSSELSEDEPLGHAEVEVEPAG